MTSQTSKIPPVRFGHAFIYDPVRDEMLLFGGASESGSFLNDTWSWDGDSWKQHDVPAPPPRGFSAVSFHDGRKTNILHGGRGNERNTYTDTWEWDGSAWRQLEADGPYQADHHQIVYVEHENVMMGFGGWNGQDVLGETWLWDGEWQPLSGACPRKRAAYGMAYDVKLERVVLFGGLWVSGQYADLWEWQNRTWQQLGGPYDNSSLDHHAMIYDYGRQQPLIFGGKNYRYQPLSWTQTIQEDKIQPVTAEGPSPRISLGLTYDTNRNRAILFGGKAYQGEVKTPLGDLWIWDGEQWTEYQG